MWPPCCLFALFAFLRTANGSFRLVALVEGKLTPGMATAIFVLALLGFGIKVGIMPLHVWLPSAHATAPSHVSAILSGVILKMGVYGFVRIDGVAAQSTAGLGSERAGAGSGFGRLGSGLCRRPA